MKKGKIYGVGVGPGDPELMTLKAVRPIREADVIAVPGEDPERSVAYKIAAGAVTEIAEKELLGIPMPMVKDRALIDSAHRKDAALLSSVLDQGKSVVYLTLGDPTLYCTFTYVQHYLEANGYTVDLVPGISSVMAAAARLGIPLTEWDEPLHVLPAVHKTGEAMDGQGTYVLMKSASHMIDLKEMLRASGKDVQAVLNCGMENETVCRSLDEIPDDAGYFALLIAKDRK